MKTIITSVLMAITIQVYSQCGYSKNEVDDFTGQVTKKTKSEVVGDNLFISAVRIGNDYGAYIMQSKHACVGNDSYVIFKFTDGTVLKKKHITGFSCDDTPSITVLFTEQSLQNNPIEKMRVKYSDTYRDVDCTNPNILIDHYKCLISEDDF